MSPYLLVVYLDELPSQLVTAKVGCTVAKLFANDIFVYSCH